MSKFMKCRQANKKLLAFYNNELTKADSDKFRLHLETCSHCREECDSLLHTINDIKTLQAVELSPDFAERLNRKIMAFEKETIKKKGIKLSSLRNLREYLIFSPESLWPKVAAGILIVCFIAFTQVSWSLSNLDYSLAKVPALEKISLTEIELNYNFFGIGIENRDGDISVKMRIGS